MEPRGAADRRSFGCAPDHDLTYFGRAFFAEALAGRRSLPAAFEDARARIEEREAREEKTPSLPQMAAGDEIVARLEDLERRLEAGEGPAGGELARSR